MEIVAKHVCDSCDKVFVTRQAKYSHKKHNCHGANNSATMRAEITVMQQELDAVKLQLASVMAPHSSTTNTTTTTTTNNINNNNNNNNNNNITIMDFRGVDTSYIAHDIVAELIKRGDLRSALQEMVEMVHFNPDHPENINAYLADAKHEHGLFFRGGHWQSKSRDELAKLVMFNAAQVMNEHNDEPYENEYSKKQTFDFDRFYSSIGYDRKPLSETIDTMAKNRNVVESAHPSVRSEL